MKLIGLTGGIASGKSTVGKMLRSAGIPVVDADQLAREAVEPGTPALAAIVARFGSVLAQDGSLDRKRLGDVIFHDEEARRALNGIVHPVVAELAFSRLQELRDSGAPVAVYEVPLLFENNLDAMMDSTIVVAASEPVQLSRLRARDLSTEADARARMASQMPLAEKCRRATVVVDNDGTLDETAQALSKAWRVVTGEDRAFGPANPTA